MRPHKRQPTRLLCPWDSPGKNTGVGCHFLLQCMKVKSQSEVAQSCPTFSDPMDCSLPGSSVHGIFQARAESSPSGECWLERASPLSVTLCPNSSQEGGGGPITQSSTPRTADLLPSIPVASEEPTPPRSVLRVPFLPPRGSGLRQAPPRDRRPGKAGHGHRGLFPGSSRDREGKRGRAWEGVLGGRRRG